MLYVVGEFETTLREKSERMKKNEEMENRYWKDKEILPERPNKCSVSSKNEIKRER